MKADNSLSFVPAFLGRRIATGSGIDGNALATTALTLDSGITVATYLPSFVIFTYGTGTYTLGIAKLKIGSTAISALAPLLSLAATVPVIANVLTTGIPVDNTGALGIEVTTVNGSAATFSVAVYGFRYA